MALRRRGGGRGAFFLLSLGERRVADEGAGSGRRIGLSFVGVVRQTIRLSRTRCVLSLGARAGS